MFLGFYLRFAHKSKRPFCFFTSFFSSFLFPGAYVHFLHFYVHFLNLRSFCPGSQVPGSWRSSFSISCLILCNIVSFWLYFFSFWLYFGPWPLVYYPLRQNKIVLHAPIRVHSFKSKRILCFPHILGHMILLFCSLYCVLLCLYGLFYAFILSKLHIYCIFWDKKALLLCLYAVCGWFIGQYNKLTDLVYHGLLPDRVLFHVLSIQVRFLHKGATIRKTMV